MSHGHFQINFATNACDRKINNQRNEDKSSEDTNIMKYQYLFARKDLISGLKAKEPGRPIQVELCSEDGTSSPCSLTLPIVVTLDMPEALSN